MGKTAEFFVKIVSPTVDEFLQGPTDVRRGFLAAIVLHHLQDYWATETNKKLKKLGDELCLQCPEIAIIRSVCDAAKHGGLDGPGHVLRNASQINATAHEGLFTAPFGFGTFAEASEVWVSLDDGNRIRLELAVAPVFQLWRRILGAE